VPDDCVRIRSFQPVISSISPTSASAGGGVILSLSGVGLADLTTLNGSVPHRSLSVFVGATKCYVVSGNETLITCRLGELAVVQSDFQVMPASSVLGEEAASTDSGSNFGINNWVVQNGGPYALWTIEQGALTSSSLRSGLGFVPTGTVCGCTIPSVAFVGNDDWQDYEVSAYLRVLSTRAGFGLVSRAVGISTVASSSYVRLSVNVTSLCVSLQWSVGGVLSALASATVSNATLAIASWHTFSLAVVGASVRGVIDGQQVVAAGLPSGVSPTGRAGLFNCGETEFTVASVWLRFLARHDTTADVAVPRPSLPSGGIVPLTVSLQGTKAACKASASSFSVPPTRSAPLSAVATVSSVNGCSFQFRAESTPQLLSATVSPASARPYPRVGDEELEWPAMVIALSAAGLPADCSGVVVKVGRQFCSVNVSSCTPSDFTCTIGSLALGSYAVRLSVIGAGRAQSDSPAGVPASGAFLTVGTQRLGVVSVLSGAVHLAAVQGSNASALSLGSGGGGSDLLLHAVGAASVDPEDNTVTMCGLRCVVNSTATALAPSNSLACTLASGYPLPEADTGLGPVRSAVYSAGESWSVLGSTTALSPAVVTLHGSSSRTAQFVTRFPKVAVRKGSTILEAYLEVTSIAASQFQEISVEIAGVSGADSVTLATLASARVSGSSLLAVLAPPRSTVWRMAPWLAVGEVARSPDLSAVVQQVCVLWHDCLPLCLPLVQFILSRFYFVLLVCACLCSL
jgi:hypothetical protein